MKKVLSILFAGLLVLGSVSCVKEQLATFDLSNSTAPVINQVEQTEKAITVSFQPATFNVGFNQQMPVNYSLILTSLNGNAVNLKVPATIKDNVATISIAALSKMLIAQGLTEGSTANLEITLRALMQGATADVSGGALDAEQYISIPGYEIVIPASNPWVGFDDISAWSLIGAIESVGMNWNDDIVMYTNGSQHVAKAVKLSTSDQFKFRKDKAWGENFGAEGDTEPFVVSLDTAYPAKGGGKNLAVPADGVYDLLLDTDAETFTIYEAYITYPGFDESSPWSVIGAIASFEMNWDKDIAMITDGEWHVAEGVALTTSDQFKFRKDQAWGENFGAEGSDEPFVVTLDTEYPASAGGKNLGVPADGIYDLLVNPEAKLFKVVETLGGKSGLVGGDEPEPEPEPEIIENAWALIGAVDGTSWDKDFYMTESEGIWTSPAVHFAENAEFKLRFNNSWADEDCVGAAEEDFYATPGTAFTGAHPGKNIKIKDEGDYQVVFDPATLSITVNSMTNHYSIIGEINGSSWDKDFYMTEADGVWTSEEVTIKGEFKVRFNNSWADADVYGLPEGAEMKVNAELETAQPGGNFKVEEGKYTVKFDASSKKVTVIPNTAATPAWSVIGDFNGWGADAVMTQVAPGIWVSDELELTDGGWKLRYNSDWDINRGGGALTQQGEFTAAYPNGDNLTLAGKMRVVFNENNQTIGTLGWGVVGKVASIDGFSWNNDIPMNLAADGKWYSVPVKLSEGDEIKLRWGAGWDTNLGLVKLADTKAEGSGDQSFELQEDGSNFVVTQEGTYMLVLDPTAKLLTLSTDFWSLIGEFNGWAGDVFMLPDGSGKWFAYNQEISGGWKIRKGADWTVSAGGTYAAAGEAFDAVTENGPNIAVTDMTRFDVAYDTAAGKITVSKPVK